MIHQIYYFGSILTILYTFIQFRSLKTSTLEFLAEIDDSPAYYRNSMSGPPTSNGCQNYLAFLVKTTGHLNSGNLKRIEKQQTVHEFVQQCVVSLKVKLKLLNFQIRQTTSLILQTPSSF